MTAALSDHAVEAAWFDTVDRCWCGGVSAEVSPHSPAYRVCARCGAHFSTTRLKPECVTRFYSFDGYWHRRQAGKHHPTLWEREAIFSSEADGRVRLWLELIARHAGARRGVAVEVGCAEGTLLRRLRDDGWSPVGIEPDPAAAAAVRERTGLDIRAGAFPEQPAPPCELFVACDVLEHVGDQQGFLRAVHTALRPGGLLFLQLPLLEPHRADFGHMNEKVFDPQEHVFVHSRASLRTLLETTGFTVLENDAAWRPAHEITIARRAEPVARPAPGRARLANLAEMFSPEWTGLVDELNAFAAPLGLRQFTNWSKIWEYPALWHGGLAAREWRGAAVLDLGSEQSPFPWWLAARGARVTLVETRADWVPQWEAIRARLGVAVDWRIVPDCRLPFPADTFDAVTSLSVIEHQDDKATAVGEVARVLRPGSVFAVSFDICEPALGMTFPEWNGRALTLDEFARVIWRHPAFGETADPAWNRGNIAPFLRWHRTTAPHHNYVTGAAVLTKVRPPWWRRCLGLAG